MVKISPSVLTADFTKLGEAIKELDFAKTDMLHLDVMDGIFVPNISFGMPVVKSIREITDTILDVHLMIDRPHRYIEEFAKSGADIIGFHTEANSPIEETLDKIHSLGCKTCLTIKPKTPAEDVFPYLDKCDMILVMSVEPGFGGQGFMPMALDKLHILKAEITKRGLNTLLEVDGGINDETGPLCVKAGADVLVVGSFLFKAEDVAKRAKEFLAL